jgi:hypothetical protein
MKLKLALNVHKGATIGNEEIEMKFLATALT